MCQIGRAACEDYETPQHCNESLIETVAELKDSGTLLSVVYSDLLTSLPLGFPVLQDTATVSQGLAAHPQRLHAGYRGVTGEPGLKQILPQKVPEQNCKRELNSAIWCEKNREKYELRNSQPEPCAEPLLV